MELVGIAQRDLDLLRQIDHDVIHDGADGSIHVEDAKRGIRVLIVARIHDLEQFLYDLLDHVPIRFFRGSDAVDRAASLVIPEDLLDHEARLILKAEVSLTSCHLLHSLFFFSLLLLRRL